MALKILLINPNNYKSPPVLPIGLEYIKESLKNQNYDLEILDLTFKEDPLLVIKEILEINRFDLIGFSIRNIDSCIYFNNEFFLPLFKKIIDFIKSYNIPIVLGGSGFTAIPYEIIEYLQVDYGIVGPGEKAFSYFLEMFQTNQLNKRIINGWDYGIDESLVSLKVKAIDYKQYIKNDGLIGFTTHTGCSNRCPYCIEANKPVSFRKIENIIEEIKMRVYEGYNHFHLCDSEFNQDLEFSKKFCKELIKKSLDLKWTLYMKPTPYDEELFQLLSESKAYLITLSVDSDRNIQLKNQYSYNDLENIIRYCRKYDIELAIDLLTGYPYESIKSTKRVIEFFKKNHPKSVGISFYYRLLNNTLLAELIRKDKNLQTQLTRKYSTDDNFLTPIFYSQYKKEEIEDIIGKDKLFRISGLTLGVNYQL